MSATLFAPEEYVRIESPWGSGPMPLWWLPQNERAEIERLAALPDPPPKWISLGCAQITSRAWWEWHWRRGHDPSRTREAIPAWMRRAVLKRDGYVCQLCGFDVDPEDVHLDHRHPVARGGETTVGNLQVAHSVCNIRKGAKLLEGAS